MGTFYPLLLPPAMLSEREGAGVGRGAGGGTFVMMLLDAWVPRWLGNHGKSGHVQDPEDKCGCCCALVITH